jgi:haloalkane dehalogenase
MPPLPTFVIDHERKSLMSEMYSPAAIPDWKLADAPTLPDCVPVESDVAVHITEEGVRFVRTPEERFANLPGYPFAPHYLMIEGLRMHYIDEGPGDGQVVLLLHGQPTWSYLYRKMIPPMAAAGYRVIAVDHIGMGRSDKPVELSFHTFEKHVQRHKAFIAALGLNEITLFCQDWGSLMGLRIAGDQPELFARIIVANGTLPVIPRGMNPFRLPNPVEIDCSLGDFTRPASLNPASWSAFFQRWILFALASPNFTPSQVVSAMAIHPLTPEEKAAYDAPYPSFVYKAAVRAFPSMLAAIEEENAPAWNALGEYNKPFLFLAGEHDPNMGSVANQQRVTSHIPGAQGQPHERFEAGHFIQEDIGETLAAKVVSFMQANPLPHNNTTATQPRLNMRGQMHGARYGEVLLVTGHLNHLQATVYNTLGLNDCPDQLWYELDADAIKREYKARAAILNGPRYFLMDEIGSADVQTEIHTFGGLQMRRMATVSIPLSRVAGGFKNRPYTETTVNRTTIYVFNKGREVYELIAPDGTTYIMQSYSLMIDRALNEETLKTLGARLHLPSGWRYRVRQLDEDCVLQIQGKAYVLQDDFANSYQRVG